MAVGQSYASPARPPGRWAAPITLNNGTLVLALAATSATPTTFNLSAAGNALTLAGTNDSIIAAADPTGTVSVSSGTINLAGSTVSIASAQKLNLGSSSGYSLTIDPALKFSNSSGTISGGPGSVALQLGNLTASQTGTLTPPAAAL